MYIQHARMPTRHWGGGGTGRHVAVQQSQPSERSATQVHSSMLSQRRGAVHKRVFGHHADTSVIQISLARTVSNVVVQGARVTRHAGRQQSPHKVPGSVAAARVLAPRRLIRRCSRPVGCASPTWRAITVSVMGRTCITSEFHSHIAVEPSTSVHTSVTSLLHRTPRSVLILGPTPL